MHLGHSRTQPEHCGRATSVLIGTLVSHRLLDILNITRWREVCIRQKQHHEEGVIHAENCQVRGLAEVEVKEGGGGDRR